MQRKTGHLFHLSMIGLLFLAASIIVVVGLYAPRPIARAATVNVSRPRPSATRPTGLPMWNLFDDPTKADAAAPEASLFDYRKAAWSFTPKLVMTTYDVLCPGGVGNPELNGDSLRSVFDAASSGSTADTINLTAGCDYALDDTPLYSASGPTGLDPVSNDVSGLDLTINGNGATIRRSSATPFRIMVVNSGAEVVINNVTISNGNINSGNSFGGDAQ
jgi:hypothetical protein